MQNNLYISLSIFFWSGLHSLFASIKSKSLCERYLGVKINNFFRIIYSFFSIISFLPILALMLILRDQRIYSIPNPWVILTFFIQIFASIVVVFSIKQTGVMDFIEWNSRDQKSCHSMNTLQTGGLYGIVRHPAYFAGLVILWCSPIMTVNYLVFCMCMTFYVLLGLISRNVS